MEKPVKVEMKDFAKDLKTYGPKTIHGFLSALLIWLFGNLVFIPLTDTLGWQARTMCTLIFFTAFSIIILRSIPNLKKLVDAFSIPLARKYSGRMRLSHGNSLVLSKHILYIIAAMIVYLLYFPFLMSFHPAINGVVLLVVLIWIFFLALRIVFILFPKLLEWLYS